MDGKLELEGQLREETQNPLIPTSIRQQQNTCFCNTKDYQFTINLHTKQTRHRTETTRAIQSLTQAASQRLYTLHETYTALGILPVLLQIRH